jgi:stage V sporulation protein G
MLITAIKVTPVNKQNLLAVASITLCDSFVLRAMRLMEGRRRRYLAMPSRQTRTGRVFEVYHPITAEARQVLESVITDSYDAQVGGREYEPKVPVRFGSERADFVITGIRVRPYDELKLKGFASMVVDDSLVINGIKIITGKDRSFIQMPNVKKKSGRFRDLAFPTVPEIRQLIEKTVFDEYQRVLNENQASLP